MVFSLCYNLCCRINFDRFDFLAEKIVQLRRFEQTNVTETELQKFQRSVFDSVENFIAKQRAKPSLPSNHVQKVINDGTIWLSGPLSVLGRNLEIYFRLTQFRRRRQVKL